MYPETPGFSTTKFQFRALLGGALAIRVIAGLRCPPEVVPVLAHPRQELCTQMDGKAAGYRPAGG